MSALIIHGHFYQPPRENPWTGIVDPEPSAHPFHDWNERVHAECYEPNSAVRILDADGLEQIINNYAHISFDFGPTLLSWLEREHSATYLRIIEADSVSALQHHGHGNAIAQAYNHAILPLCNERDRRTQVRWGIADFRHRFGRMPESVWLPETACNDDVLDLLIDEGLRFVILAPHQALRFRQTRTGANHPTLQAEWQNVDSNTLDTSVSYNRFHSDGSARSIAIFFYDQKLAHEIAFEQALSSSASLVDRFAQRQVERPGLINLATDGETYGHHHKFGDLCLAHALKVDAPARGFSVSNYGEFLDAHPPQFEVQLNNGVDGEGTSWSCVHGVGRWIRDCGCQTGGEPGWQQSWRGPLRRTLDYLRDAAAAEFAATTGELFTDPWLARDDSISLILNAQESRERFLSDHAPRQLNREQQRRALLFLEVQRNALLMYTSCAWFFNDISGIEPVQILKYAGRVIDLMEQLQLTSPRSGFLEILAEAKSNRTELGNGAEIFRRSVEPLLNEFVNLVD